MKNSNSIVKNLLVVFLLFIANTVTAQPILRIFPKGDKPHGAVFFLLVILALFIVLAVHELGHLIAGMAQGFRFELFIVGLLGIRRSDKGIKFFLNKNIGYMGGIAASVPVTQSPKNKKRFAITLLAGPLASLLFAVVSFALLFASTSGAARGFWLVAGAGSLSIFFATTLPTKSGLFFTDRARFQRLISKGKAGETEEALLSIIAQNVADGSSKNISLHKARLMQADDDAIMRFWGYYYEYYYFKDNDLKEDADKAKEKLLAVKSTIPKQVWKALKIDEQETPIAQ